MNIKCTPFLNESDDEETAGRSCLPDQRTAGAAESVLPLGRRLARPRGRGGVPTWLSPFHHLPCEHVPPEQWPVVILVQDDDLQVGGVFQRDPAQIEGKSLELVVGRREGGPSQLGKAASAPLGDSGQLMGQAM